MRKDYKYVDDATSVCLTTTDAGHKFLEGLDVDTKYGDYEELLLYIEQDYARIDGGIEDWVSQVNKQYKESYGNIYECTKEIIMKALANGHLGIHKVVWD